MEYYNKKNIILSFTITICSMALWQEQELKKILNGQPCCGSSTDAATTHELQPTTELNAEAVITARHQLNLLAYSYPAIRRTNQFLEQLFSSACHYPNLSSFSSTYSNLMSTNLYNSTMNINSSVNNNNNNNTDNNQKNNNNNMSESIDVDTIERFGSKCKKKRTIKLKMKEPLHFQQSNLSNIRTLATMKNDKPRKFKCLVCSRSFAYKHVLQNHHRTHTGEKPFECFECPKRFTRDHHLKTHMRLHTGEKPYRCKFCGKDFVQVANLRRHERVHTGERPYKCSKCTARFSDSNQLKAHEVIHENEKPFMCTHCGTDFTGKKTEFKDHKCSRQQEAITEASSSSPKPRSGNSSPSSPPATVDQWTPLFGINEDNMVEQAEMSARIGKMTISPINQCQIPSVSIAAPRSTVPTSVPTLSIPRISVMPDLPEQIEPEDLSMSTGRYRSRYDISSSYLPVNSNDRRSLMRNRRAMIRKKKGEIKM